jgi:hypothetical protein
MDNNCQNSTTIVVQASSGCPGGYFELASCSNALSCYSDGKGIKCYSCS